jgi:hypothetical protein
MKKFIIRGWRRINERPMNNAAKSAHLHKSAHVQSSRFAAVRRAHRRARVSRALACLLMGLIPSAASALVGPAREAPDLEPYVVMVLSRSGSSASFCSASVIARNIVLTAAHCVTGPDDARVFFRDAKGQSTMLDVASIAINPGYRPDAIRRRLISIDLALVRLVEPLPEAFTPVDLAKSASAEVGQIFRIAGFGVADEGSGRTGGVLREGNLVASGPRSAILLWLKDPNHTGLGACTGDSGAPVFAAKEPILVAVAVWARGENGHICGALTQAVRIAPQRPWIENALSAWSAAGRATP